jgi:hypothetical protein
MEDSPFTLDVVMFNLRLARPGLEACRASEREKPIKRVNTYFHWY